MTVFGTRPEAIKMATLCHEIKKQDDFELKVCVTGQHREMLDQVLDLFELSPDIDLNLMKRDQDLTDITSSTVLSMRSVLQEHKPDLVMVHGDTTTTFASSVAAFYQNIKVGHVEAGLRTNNIYSPFPEEFNRKIVSNISRLHFAPTEASKSNLIDERHDINNIFVTGNTVIDSLFWILKKIDDDEKRRHALTNTINSSLNFDWQKEKFILITAHRRENFGDGFIQICKAIYELSQIYPDINFIYPVHLNPNVQDPVIETLSNIKNINLIKPLEYEFFVYLMKKSYLVLTDSGGIQEEAPALGKPVLVMRDVTERPEALEAGTVKLVGTSKDAIIKEVANLLENDDEYIKMSMAHNPFGDGKASFKIINAIRKYFNE